MSTALEVKDLTVRYGDAVAVDAATFAVEEGALAALVGPSGCGKTSLLRAIAGFERPARGSITIGGADVANVPPEKRHVGMVFQQGALFPHLSVLDNVAFGLRRGETDRALESLALVGLADLASRRPHELSGGQQQRVALARAMAPRPSLVLLDEPFGGLDAALRVRLRDEVRTILRDTSTTAVLVTHDQEEALSIADQVSVMQSGKILQTGTPRQIYDEPSNEAVAELIGDAHLLPAMIMDGRVVTPFGALRVDAPDGRCVVRLSSEDLTIDPTGTPATIVNSHFYGHDVVDEVQLGDGRKFRVRGPRSAGSPGTRVGVRLRSARIRVLMGEEATFAYQE